MNDGFEGVVSTPEEEDAFRHLEMMQEARREELERRRRESDAQLDVRRAADMADGY